MTAVKTDRFPVSIKRGSVSVKIYRLDRGDGRTLFTLSWHAGGRRFTKQFSAFEDAHSEGTLKCEQLAAGRIDGAAMDRTDRDELSAAREIVGSGELLSALREWARARDLTDGHVIAAAEAWKARNVARFARRKVSDVVTEFCKAKTKAGFNVADDHYSIFKAIKGDLGEQFIDSVSARALDAWLAKRENAVSRNTYRKRVVSVWRWAQKRGYLPRDVKTEAEQTERAREEAPPIGIISADTFAKLLELVRANGFADLPTAVIAGFTGLRRAELHGQTWEDVNLAEKFVRVTRAKRGTPARRLVPLSDAAVGWLLLCPNRKGAIGEGMAVDRVRKLGRENRLELPDNCLRHAYISHRVAQTGSIAETSLEAGNSPKIINAHYRELVTKKEGEAWFCISPSTTHGKAVIFG